MRKVGFYSLLFKVILRVALSDEAGELQLVNPAVNETQQTTSGAVQIFCEGSWYPLGTAGGWTLQDANVSCKTWGFPLGGVNDVIVNEGNFSCCIVYGGFTCNGSETSLSQCMRAVTHVETSCQNRTSAATCRRNVSVTPTASVVHSTPVDKEDTSESYETLVSITPTISVVQSTPVDKEDTSESYETIVSIASTTTEPTEEDTSDSQLYLKIFIPIACVIIVAAIALVLYQKRFPIVTYGSRPFSP